MLPIPLLLLACSTPEEDAEAAGLAFLQAQLTQDLPAAHARACADERRARPLQELLEAKSALDNAGLLGAAAKEMADKLAKDGSIQATATVLDEVKSSGTLHYDISVDEEKTGSNTLELRLEEGTWCAVPGWVLENQAAELDEKLESAFADATAAMKDFRFDEAETSLTDLQQVAALVPESSWTPRTQREMDELPKSLEAIRGMKARHVGGRWLVDVGKDPMTDHINATAQLRSTNEMKAWGKDHPATLYVRCSRRELDVFIHVPFILESDWRYNSVPGQYRFGSEPPQRLRANKGKDSQYAFFRGSREWAGRLVERQSDKWTIELSPFDGGPTPFFFDLAAADKAIGKVLAACPR